MEFFPLSRKHCGHLAANQIGFADGSPVGDVAEVVVAVPVAVSVAEAQGAVPVVLEGQFDVGVVIVDKGEDGYEERDEAEDGNDVPLGKGLGVEHGEGFDRPHEQLVAGQLLPQAGQPGLLGRAMTLVLLMQDFSRAQSNERKERAKQFGKKKNGHSIFKIQNQHHFKHLLTRFV